jgi:hypothetical protein
VIEACDGTHPETGQPCVLADHHRGTTRRQTARSGSMRTDSARRRSVDHLLGQHGRVSSFLPLGQHGHGSTSSIAESHRHSRLVTNGGSGSCAQGAPHLRQCPGRVHADQRSSARRSSLAGTQLIDPSGARTRPSHSPRSRTQASRRPPCFQAIWSAGQGSVTRRTVSGGRWPCASYCSSRSAAKVVGLLLAQVAAAPPNRGAVPYTPRRRAVLAHLEPANHAHRMPLFETVFP